MAARKPQQRKKRQAVKEPACLNIGEWRAATRQEVADWVTRDRKRKKSPPAILVIRFRLKPVDIYCYLKARFGEPNGFQNFLRRDDSDNWIHWDYSLKAGKTDVYISGMSREIHMMVSETLTDKHWQDLIVGIRTDYARVGPQKSAVLRSLEKYVVFQNKFVSIAGLCADLHAAIVGTPAKPPRRSKPMI